MATKFLAECLISSEDELELFTQNQTTLIRAINYWTEWPNGKW